jgi:hypothetical protein
MTLYGWCFKVHEPRTSQNETENKASVIHRMTFKMHRQAGRSLLTEQRLFVTVIYVFTKRYSWYNGFGIGFADKESVEHDGGGG